MRFPRLRCDGCGAATSEQIVLKNSLWERIGEGASYRQVSAARKKSRRDPEAPDPQGGNLCFDCIEERMAHRLGRKLRISDLLKCPLNVTWAAFLWLRETAKKESIKRVPWPFMLELYRRGLPEDITYDDKDVDAEVTSDGLLF